VARRLPMNVSTDSIERKIMLKASMVRVGRAWSNAEELGTGSGVDLKGKTMRLGETLQGRVTYPGDEHLLFEAFIERGEPQRLLSWPWHPAPIDPSVDYSQEPSTLVVFD
jgi:hypothetical protein